MAKHKPYLYHDVLIHYILFQCVGIVILVNVLVLNVYLAVLVDDRGV